MSSPTRASVSESISRSRSTTSTGSTIIVSNRGGAAERLRRADRPELGLARIRPPRPGRLRLVDLPGQVGRAVDLIGSLRSLAGLRRRGATRGSADPGLELS